MPLSRRQFLSTTAAVGASCLLPRTTFALDAAVANSPITNAWGKAKTTVLKADDVIVFEGKPGAAFSHQTQLTSHDGRLFLTWTLGVRDEEGPGERMALATSDDAGKTWSKPSFIFDTKPGDELPVIYVSSGLRAHGDKLIAYAGEWQMRKSGLNADGSRIKSHAHRFGTRGWIKTSSDRGATWSDPIEGPRVAGYLPPAPIASGRLVWPGNVTFPYSDDPAGVTGWKFAALPKLTDGFEDLYEGKARELRGDKLMFSEGSFYQTDDGVIHMMLRTDTLRLAVTESRDNGQTWSEPMLTDFTDSASRAVFGRLPDGRFYGIGCSRPTMKDRTYVVLATSTDGVVFDRHYVLGDEPVAKPRIPGAYKHGRFNYPFLHVSGEHAFVSYARCKEDVYVRRFPLAQLA